MQTCNYNNYCDSDDVAGSDGVDCGEDDDGGGVGEDDDDDDDRGGDDDDYDAFIMNLQCMPCM